MFQLLGRLAVVDGGGRAINVRAAKQQAILAVLMLRPGGVVSVDRLMTELWPDEPPATARASLQTYVYRLRRTLAPLAAHGVDLTTLGNGYTLVVPDRAVDIRAFEQRFTRGSEALTAGSPAAAAGLLREALDMWHGPLAPEIDVETVRRERRRLDAMHLTASELWVEAELRLGLHTGVIPELERLVEAHPFRESLWEMLLRALAGRGRRAEALAAYRRMRDILSTELGIEPADSLRRQHQEILRGAPL
ncbi:AfsR/SARP family transcriptional regulator [Nonomuraea muscovyensis]|uniref:DNA-binding SARP family transcriptional activator n=1 Tax=Nonomuraea muscovyensis TaxID=1124761 RepID=A0A7X0EZ69_9ACTN|nr:BTAD domain-containing putative transcriptional regulator [Nonomuraea muscovyensis]MBB6349877.1 DNA-binding SARP family transcriptional activator [Nonomuraea muscovyensis]